MVALATSRPTTTSLKQIPSSHRQKLWKINGDPFTWDIVLCVNEAYNVIYFKFKALSRLRFLGR